MSMVSQPVQQVAIRKNALSQIHEELKLSLAPEGSLPGMLTSAPIAINFLGQIRLLAYSDNIICVQLDPPAEGFRYLRYRSLTSAIQQIVNNATKVFDLASTNMQAINMQTRELFGRSSYAQNIFQCLKDPDYAKENLLNSIGCFESGMQKCATFAQGIEDELRKLVDCSEELEEAITAEITTTERRRKDAEKAAMEKRKQEEFKKILIDDLQRRCHDSDSEFRDARAEFYRTAKSGELKAWAIGSLVDATSNVNQIVHGTIGLFRKTTHAVSYMAKGDTPVRLDPGLLSADMLEASIFQLHDIFYESFAIISPVLKPNLATCSGQLKRIKETLTDFESKHTTSARLIVDNANDMISAATQFVDNYDAEVSDKAETMNQILIWQKNVKSLLDQATRLRSFAAAQPGAGFGNRIEDTDPSSSGFEKVARSKQQRMQIMRSAANEAKETLLKTRDAQLAAQAKMIELAKDIESLDFEKAEMAQTKQVLKKTIDALKGMQTQFKNLTEFFTGLTHVIGIVGMGQGKLYIDHIQQGFKGVDGDELQLAVEYSEYQKQVIRDTVINLRGYFGFVAHSTDLYQRISREHILPCLREASRLPLSASPAEQIEAKRDLSERTAASASAISELAQQEFQDYFKGLEGQVQMIDIELGQLGPLQFDNREAIEAGVHESNVQTQHEIQEDDEWFDDDI